MNLAPLRSTRTGDEWGVLAAEISEDASAEVQGADEQEQRDEHDAGATEGGT